MKNNNLNINAFDDALLDVIINEQQNPKIENIMNNTTEYVYNQGIAISINKDYEGRFLNSAKSSKFLNFLNNKSTMFISLIAVITTVLYFNFYQINNENPKLGSVGIIKPDTNISENSTEIKTDTLNTLKAEPKIKTAEPKELLTQSPKIAFDSVEYKIQNLKQDDDTNYKVLDHKKALAVMNEPENYKFNLGDYKIELKKLKLHLPFYESIKGIKKEDSIDFKTEIPMYLGIPFTKDFDFMEYISITPEYQNESDKHSNLILPLSINYDFDYRLENDKNSIISYFNKNENMDKLQPFYISKNEVTNIEYNEFLYWVKRYNGFDRNSPIDSLAKDSNAYKKAFTYTFHKKNPEIIKHFGKNSINVFPDTNVWDKDFPTYYLEPFKKLYIYHPAYKNFPVVGISYYQALAFCDWLTWVWQNRMDVKNIPYELTFDLPYSYEWESTVNYVMKENTLINDTRKDLSRFYNNLIIKETNNLLFIKAVGSNANSRAPFMLLIVHKDNEGIQELSENASEWLKDDYSDSYKTFKTKLLERAFTLGKISEKSYKLINQLDDFYMESFNNENGKLVIGANWYDHREENNNINFEEKSFAKAFIHPDSAHSTIGFRFVMRVKLKDEDKIRKKVKYLGHALPLMDYNTEDDKIIANNTLENPNGYKFVPMGIYGETSIQSFWAKTTEVSNFEYMLFLNHLIDYNRDEDFKVCLPSNPKWSYKMKYEVYPEIEVNKKEFFNNICFSKDFLKLNNLEDFELTNFAVSPVSGISKKAAELYCRFLSDVYSGETEYHITVRIPFESEWEYMASGGIDSNIFAWNGIYPRDSRGLILANFNWNTINTGKLKIDTLKNNQNVLAKSIQGKWPVMHFSPNNFGLYDLSGNVAEMIADKAYTKGGSYKSPEEKIKIKSHEKWDGKPSDRVGFRVVITHAGKP